LFSIFTTSFYRSFPHERNPVSSVPDGLLPAQAPRAAWQEAAMKVTFIKPNMGLGRSSAALPPLGIAVLAGHTPQDVEKELYDESIEKVPLDIQTDLAAISVDTTFSARRSYELADHFRKRGIPVVMGGYHPTLISEEALAHADAVVKGPAEQVWQQVIRDARQGSLSRVYEDAERRPVLHARYDMSLFSGKRYNMISPVEFTRGCIYDCEFCTVSVFNKRRLSIRPVESVIDDIRRAGRRTVFIIDDNILSNKARARELFQALIPLKVRWGCQISIDVARDPGLLKLMQQSGCILFIIGFESLRAKNLEQMSKGSHRSDREYPALITRIRDHGIMIYGSFVLGYDFDTVDIFEQTLEFALKHKFTLANFNTLNPMPGTRLYDRLKAEGRLLEEKWWLHEKYSYGEVSFAPRLMTPRQLKDGCVQARLAFNSVAGIAQRAFDLKSNCKNPVHLALFLGMNIIARKEIKNKMERIHEKHPAAE
jgi:radical SAM superfamily enzyme YgiQ (UPF0313 family)